MSLMLQRQSLFSSHTGHVMAGVISRKHICSFFLYTYLYFIFSFVFPIFFIYAFAGGATRVFIVSFALQLPAYDGIQV